MKRLPDRFATHGPRHSSGFALLKIIFSLGMLWLLALAITRGLTGAPADTVAIAPGAPIQRKIEWRPVADSHGYLLQLRDEKARVILERRLAESRTTVELPAGSYSLRVASLNKFGKPASWSAWANLHLRRSAATREAPRPPAPADREDSNAESDARSADQRNAANQSDAIAVSGPGLDWRIFVPGWSQYARGQTFRGLAWMTGFAGLGAAGYGFWQTGNNLALSAEAATPLLLLAPLSGQPAASLVLLQDRASARSAYNASQANQRIVGLVAGVLYLLQIADALWFAPESAEAPVGPANQEARSGITALQFGEIRLSAELIAPGRAYTEPRFVAGSNKHAGNEYREPNEGVELRFTKHF